MAFLVAAVVLVGALCALDLILTVGVIRRLREHSDLIADIGGLGDAPVMAVGEEIPGFSASTVNGTELSHKSLTEETLVAFFSPTCEPCKKKMPSFVEYARAAERRGGRVVAAVVGDTELAEAFVSELAPVADVVVEENTEGGISAAFKVSAFPTLLRVAPDRSGRLVVTSNDVELGGTVTAAA